MGSKNCTVGSKGSYMNLIEAVKIVLANNFALYLKAHYFHWNVEGPDFAQFHEFFDNLYTDFYSSIDHFAEEIRALNAYAPGSFERYTELAQIKGEDRVLSAPEMLKQLLNDNETMMTSLKAAYELANKADEIGLSNFIQDRTDQHKKHAWMIRSFLKGR
jgi:starvation-inducible DNA-binding protein